MAKNKEYRTVLGTTYEVMNYEGVLLQKNPMTNLWMMFFVDPKTYPWTGKLNEVKEMVDDFKNRDMLDVLRPYTALEQE